MVRHTYIIIVIHIVSHSHIHTVTLLVTHIRAVIVTVIPIVSLSHIHAVILIVRYTHIQ